jgi:hypothetical protein
VGATGKVVGLDLNAGRLAVARSLALDQGAEIEWREENVMTLPGAVAMTEALQRHVSQEACDFRRGTHNICGGHVCNHFYTLSMAALIRN